MGRKRRRSGQSGRLHMRSAGGAKGNDATAAAAARGLPAPRAIVVATSSLAIAPRTACQDCGSLWAWPSIISGRRANEHQYGGCKGHRAAMPPQPHHLLSLRFQNDHLGDPYAPLPSSSLMAAEVPGRRRGRHSLIDLYKTFHIPFQGLICCRSRPPGRDAPGISVNWLGLA